MRRATVLPPVFGPVTTRAVNSPPSRMSIGTTRPVSPGWRADSSTTSGRPVISGADASTSPARCGVATQKSNLGARASPRVSAQRPGLGRDVGRQLVEDALHLGLLGRLRLAPGVPQLDDHQRLDEECLAAPRCVVDDPLDPAPGVGPDRNHVAPLRVSRSAPGGRCQLRRPMNRSRRRRSRSYATRTAIRSPPRRGEAVSSSSPVGSNDRARVDVMAGRGWKLAAQIVKEGPPVVGQVRPAGRPRRSRGDVEELIRIRRPPRAARSIARPDVVRHRRSRPRPLHEKARAWSVSSRPRATSTGSVGLERSASRRPGGECAGQAAHRRKGTPARIATSRAFQGLSCADPARRLARYGSPVEEAPRAGFDQISGALLSRWSDGMASTRCLSE